jgi:hypothetical protein
MSGFYWPEPDLSFLPATKATGDGEARYFVCHNKNILQFIDKKKHGAQLLAKSLVSSTKFKSITWEC